MYLSLLSVSPQNSVLNLFPFSILTAAAVALTHAFIFSGLVDWNILYSVFFSPKIPSFSLIKIHKKVFVISLPCLQLFLYTYGEHRVHNVSYGI